MSKDLRYPIGEFKSPVNITKATLESWIEVLEQFPNRLEKLVSHLNQKQLDTPYRQGGWTIRQVVHHCADSHHHSYIRFKWALTEDNPTIKAYDEKLWAELFDSKTTPIILSINHLKSVHAKLVYLLKGIPEESFDKTFYHPESKEKVVLKNNVGIYAWHCNHHYAHIENLLIKKNWI